MAERAPQERQRPERYEPRVVTVTDSTTGESVKMFQIAPGRVQSVDVVENRINKLNDLADEARALVAEPPVDALVEGFKKRQQRRAEMADTVRAQLEQVKTQLEA